MSLSTKNTISIQYPLGPKLASPSQTLLSSLWSSAPSVVKKYSPPQTLPVKPFNLLTPIAPREPQRLSTLLSKIRVHLCESVSQFLIPSHRLPQITIEFIGIWKRVNNPDFNVTEFSYIRNESGSNGFVLSLSSSRWPYMAKKYSPPQAHPIKRHPILPHKAQKMTPSFKVVKLDHYYISPLSRSVA
jgi:hypothetical protein